MMAPKKENTPESALNETPDPAAAMEEVASFVELDQGKSYVASMSLSAWMSMPDHAKVRDVERRVQDAHWEYLRNVKGPALEALNEVAAAEFAGRLCKVDGHTRTMLWAQNKLPKPSRVYVTIYRCENLEEVDALYVTSESRSSKEPMYEKVKRAFLEHGLVITAHRLKHGMIGDPLSIAMTSRANSKETSGQHTTFDVSNAVKTFKQEILLLNEINPPQNATQSGVIAAALIAFSESLQHVAFFTNLARNKGQSRGISLCDPVEIMNRYVQSLKGKNANTKDVQIDLCARCLAAADLYLPTKKPAKYWSSVPPEPIELLPRVQAVLARKESQGS